MATNIQNGKPTAGTRMLTIGALSRAVRIPVETLRSWERRYGSPVPVRKPSGHRVYPIATVEQLRLVMRLLAHGHRPSDLLGLSMKALESLLALSEPTAATVPTLEVPGSAPGSPARSVEVLMRATAALDQDALGVELRAAWVRLGAVPFLDEVAGPFMAEIGRAWRARDLSIRHEHLASACLSDFLRSARDPYDRDARGPRVVLAMLPGDHHEGGLLMLALLLAVRGHQVVYLGLETPIEEITATALARDVEVVAVSVSPQVKQARSRALIADLRKLLPSRVALWLGGSGAPPDLDGVERFGRLADLNARLSDIS